MTDFNDNELIILTGIRDSSFSYFDEGITEGSGIWYDCLRDEANVHGRVIASLVKKGIFDRAPGDDSDDGDWISLTAEGVAIITALTVDAPETMPLQPVKGHTNTAPHSRSSHAECYANDVHPKTPQGRAGCRKSR